MSLETDITIIKRLVEAQPIFKSASPQQIQNRYAERIRQEEEAKRRREQERLDKEERAARAKVEAKDKMMRALRLLGMTKVEHNPDDWTVRCTGSNQAGEQISMQLYGDRITVNGRYPYSSREHYTGDVYDPENNNNKLERPEITISAGKTPEQMVRDIQRRFTPFHQRYHTLAKKKAEADDAYEYETTSNLAAIKGSKLSEYEEKERRISISSRDDGVYGHVKVSGSSVSMEINGLTVDQAKRITAVIKGRVR
jgi:hypothetical protein